MSTSTPRPGHPELLVPHRYVTLIRRILADRVEETDTAGDAPDDRGLVPIKLREGKDPDEALKDLRSKASQEYNWIPTAGHNRELDLAITGQPQDSAGGHKAMPARALMPREDSTVGAGVTVGIVDTRVYANDWLYGAVVADPSDIMTKPDELDRDQDGLLDAQAAHATFTAGLVLRQAPAATVRVDHGLDNVGRGSTGGVAAAAVRLAKQGVDVLNLSLGCRTEDNLPPTGLIEMVRQIHPGIVIVAAAGNLRLIEDGESRKDNKYDAAQAFFPAALDSVVAVGAVGRRDGRDDGGWHPAPFSNYGPWLDFAAPGVDVESTFVDFQSAAKDKVRLQFRGWAFWSGTSFATAIASGTIAATMSEHGLSARDAVARLRRDEDLPVAEFPGICVPVLQQAPWDHVPAGHRGAPANSA